MTCSGIDALPSFPAASAIPSSPGFVGEGVFRQSGVVHSFKVVDPVLFVWTRYFVNYLCLALYRITIFLSLESRLLRCTHFIASSPLGLTWRLVTHFSPSAVLRPTHYQRTWTVKASQCCHPLALYFQQSNETVFRQAFSVQWTQTRVVCYNH